MAYRIFLLFLSLATFSLPLQAAITDQLSNALKGNRAETPTIKVLVTHDVKGVDLQVYGRYSLFDPHSKTHLSSRFAGKSRHIEARGEGLKWGESFPGVYQLLIKPDTKDTIVNINNKDYEGFIYIYDIGGTIGIVDQIPIEKYVSAVLAATQTQNLEKETIAALAIVARTNAIYQSKHPKTDFWAVDGQKIGFQGIVSLDPQIQQAIKETHHMIMSKTGVYEKVATPFAAQFGELPTGLTQKEMAPSKITLQEANDLAKKGEHAAQILSKAFPDSTIMLMGESK